MTRIAILVLGMHRSGTSALAGTLVKLGIAAPRTLMPPAVDNPRGFWESAAFCRFNNRVLQAAETDWDLWSRVNLDAVAPATMAAFEQDFAGLLSQEFGDAPIIGIKDPRICRLAPFWIRNLLASKVAPRVILIVRHPMEVARSLASRNGMCLEHGLLLWLRHVLESEADTRETPRMVVQYEDVLTNWRDVAARASGSLALEWPARSESTEKEIEEFVTASLRHHHANPSAHPPHRLLTEWTGTAWTALQALMVEGDASNARASLDLVRTQFDRVSPTFEAVIGSERSRSRADLQQQHLAFDAERWQLQQAIAGHRDEIAGLQRQLESAAAECHRLQQAQHELRTQLTFQNDELRQWSDWMIDSLKARAEESERQAAALRNSLSWRATALPRRIAAWMITRRRDAR